jgi:hypothetical protein
MFRLLKISQYIVKHSDQSYLRKIILQAEILKLVNK